MDSSREYDIILWGATGYTGQYTAEHIVTNLPTNLKWALAGRSQKKLSDLLKGLQQLNPDRVPPGIHYPIPFMYSLWLIKSNRH